jgi:hypothetical protein
VNDAPRDPAPQAPLPEPPGLTTIILRVSMLIAVLVLATLAAHEIRDALNLTIMPENEQQVHRGIMIGMVAYIGLLALPFVPGAEIGIALLTAFGAAIAPLIYGATVVAMMLAYCIGRLLPVAALIWVLSALRMRRAAALVTRAAPLSRQDRLALLLDGAPPRLMDVALRNRYAALALAVNTPGNSLIGGGGGIMMMAGLTGIFAPLPTLVAIIVAVSPVPVAIYLFGI